MIAAPAGCDGPPLSPVSFSCSLSPLWETSARRSSISVEDRCRYRFLLRNVARDGHAFGTMIQGIPVSVFELIQREYAGLSGQPRSLGARIVRNTPRVSGPRARHRGKLLERNSSLIQPQFLSNQTGPTPSHPIPSVPNIA